jgi:hypothetical protein
VRTIDVHGLLTHGAVPSANASSAETNVIEVAANPVGTGPPVPAMGAVVVGDVVGPLGVGAEVAVPAGAVGVIVDEADALALGPADPHPVSASAVSSAAVTIAIPDARHENMIVMTSSVPEAGRRSGDRLGPLMAGVGPFAAKSQTPSRPSEFGTFVATFIALRHQRRREATPGWATFPITHVRAQDFSC